MSAFANPGDSKELDEPVVLEELALYISAPTMIGVSGLLWTLIYFSVMSFLP